DELTRLTSASTSEEFSPDGQYLSYVRENNLYVIELETQRERPLTSDGSATIINGRLDWVYQEEIYGRDNFKGYWWSPDSKKIAYLRFDESGLKPFPVADHVPIHPEVEYTNYPLAGEPNPQVRLGVVDVAGTRSTTWIDTSAYEQDFLIVGVGWTL